MNYFRLFRFGDQYPFIASAVAAGIYIGKPDIWILYWGIASALISACGFAVNELVDGGDVDKKSWNPVHVAAHHKLNRSTVILVISAVLSAGLATAWALGVFWWGVLVFVLWFLYSVPPVRLKGQPVLDLLVQLATGIWLPFIAVLYHYGWQWNPALISLIIPLSCFIIEPVLEYQLADYSLDRQYGLRSTHVILGMQKSIDLGYVLILGGMLLFYLLGTWKSAPWSWVLVPFAVYSLYHLRSVAVLPTVAGQQEQFARYVRLVKPATWLIVPFLLWWWMFII